MHIPRQADRCDAARPAPGEVTPAVAVAPAGPTCGTVEADVEELQARRLHLAAQLRSVAYWQRLVRARTDLVVAGLLYVAPAPAPGAHVLPVTATGPCPPADTLDLQGLTAPPEGLDIGHLLDEPAWGHGHAGAGARLDRLRATAALLSGHSRALQEQLDEVTAAVHQRLAGEGGDGSRPPRPTARPTALPTGVPMT